MVQFPITRTSWQGRFYFFSMWNWNFIFGNLLWRSVMKSWILNFSVSNTVKRSCTYLSHNLGWYCSSNLNFIVGNLLWSNVMKSWILNILFSNTIKRSCTYLSHNQAKYCNSIIIAVSNLWINLQGQVTMEYRLLSLLMFMK